MAAESEKELQQLKKRFAELADRSWRQNLFVFTGFLSPAEQDALWEVQGRTGVHVCLEGGMEHAERQMARFGSPEQLGYAEPFPVVCLRVEPLQEKFADDFTHRDFLGAVMNLGIDRSTVGDIVTDQKAAFLFCTETMAPYLEENLTRVRHTDMRCRRVDGTQELPKRELAPKEENVASLRSDGIVAAVWNLSRSQSQALFKQKKIYVNGRQQESGSGPLKDGDVVSVRGYGKFIFRGERRTTKKGKLVVGFDLFV